MACVGLSNRGEISEQLGKLDALPGLAGEISLPGLAGRRRAAGRTRFVPVGDIDRE